jgi:hypothetical protein
MALATHHASTSNYLTFVFFKILNNITELEDVRSVCSVFYVLSDSQACLLDLSTVALK